MFLKLLHLSSLHLSSEGSATSYCSRILTTSRLQNLCTLPHPSRQNCLRLFSQLHPHPGIQWTLNTLSPQMPLHPRMPRQPRTPLPLPVSRRTKLLLTLMRTISSKPPYSCSKSRLNRWHGTKEPSTNLKKRIFHWLSG
jgi:hypothetical protein